MVLDEVLQQEQFPLTGELINVPVARSEDLKKFSERNPNVMMPRGKAPLEKANIRKKRWSRLHGKENVTPEIPKVQSTGSNLLGQKRQLMLRDEEEDLQESPGAKKLCPKQAVVTEETMKEVVVASLQWPQPSQ